MNVNFNPAISMGSRASMQKKVVEEVSGPVVSGLKKEIAALGHEALPNAPQIDALYGKVLDLTEAGDFVGGGKLLEYARKFGADDGQKYFANVGQKLKGMFH